MTVMIQKSESNIAFQEMQVRKHPLDRSHQANIALLLEDLDNFEDQLVDQRRVAEQLVRLLGDEGYSDTHRWVHMQVVEGVVESTSSKLGSLVGLRGKAERLAQSAREYKENKKDRQEAAIYVFTIVTIIFLPISTVSSIFGMNTSDVRDMEQSQVSPTVFYIV